jgi:hypothetical protein
VKCDLPSECESPVPSSQTGIVRRSLRREEEERKQRREQRKRVKKEENIY